MIKLGDEYLLALGNFLADGLSPGEAGTAMRRRFRDDETLDALRGDEVRVIYNSPIERKRLESLFGADKDVKMKKIERAFQSRRPGSVPTMRYA